MAIEVDEEVGEPPAAAQVRVEARAWFEQNWDPDSTLGEWWQRFGLSGWAFPTWPVTAFGRGLDSKTAKVVDEERRRIGAMGAPSGIGPMMAGPTVWTHGSQEQVERLLADMVTGKEIWCQLFSEPGSGSDLASIQTRAVRDGDEWIVNGQKVWTSGAQYSRWGILIARTNPDAPKHKGVTYFVIDIDQPGVEVRPLKEMTGGATFNEVFFSDARVPEENRLGDVNNGWAVAVTTLAHERNSLGAGALGGMMGGGAMMGLGGGEEGAMAMPSLDRRVGDLAGGGDGGAAAMMAGGGMAQMVKMLPMMLGKGSDPLIRQDIAKLYTMLEISRYTGLRSAAAAARGQQPGPEVSTGKLMASEMMRHMRDTMLRIEGADGMLMGSDAPMNGMGQFLALFSPAISIAGGTDQVQRNIIGERVLGLPSEPRVDKDVPFRDLLVGTQRGV
ncbi:MAG: acyl-CoA dehydrogenase family protein [Acidimicrobiales bacterium]|nr:acyl-CoA dehydrogenase family protein [Acidimicrobiales bacterium]